MTTTFTTRSIALLAGLAASVAGCDSMSGAAGSFTARDSAGVTIVESQAGAWAADDRWRLGEQPALRIGVVDGAAEYQFSAIVNAFRLRDGRIVVADRQAAQLRFYGPDGVFQAAAGGSGSGPGEFRALSVVVPYRGDSIFAWDVVARRFSVFDGGGRLGRVQGLTVEDPVGDRPTQGAGSMAVVIPPQLSGAFGDGTLVVAPTTRLMLDPGTTTDLAIVHLRASPEGEILGSLGTIRVPPVTVAVPGGPRAPPRPFPASLVRATHGDRLYSGTGERYEVEVRGMDGAVERLVRAHHRDLTVTEAAKEAYRESRRQAASDQAALAEIERTLREIQFPATLPAYSQLVIDSEDHLWLRDYRLPDQEGPDLWSVFDPEGRLLGDVETPEQLRVHQIGSDFVLGTWTDELEVPFVRMYPLVGRR